MPDVSFGETFVRSDILEPSGAHYAQSVAGDGLRKAIARDTGRTESLNWFRLMLRVKRNWPVFCVPELVAGQATGVIARLRYRT